MRFITLLAMAIPITLHAQKSTLKIGPAYLIHHTDSTLHTLSIVEYKNNTDYHYQLRLSDCKSAATIKESKIITTKNPIGHEQIIGRMGNVLWVNADSLTGYDVHSLAMVVTETEIASRHPFMQHNFSRLTNSYLMDEAAQVMYVGAENGDRYKLYPDMNMKPDTGSSDPAPDDFSYEFAAEYKLAGKYNLKYSLSCIDTFNKRLYIIGSKTETSQVLSYYGVGVYPERDEIRQLTSIPFNTNGDKIDFSNNKPITSPNKYFGAAFLLNKFYTTAWHGINGEHIIFYRSGADNKATLKIAMLDTTGKEKWNGDTGLAYLNFSDYLLGETHLVIWMDTYSKGEKAQKLFFINLDDGNIQIQ